MVDRSVKHLSPARSIALQRYHAIVAFKKKKVWRTNQPTSVHLRQKNKDNTDVLRGVLYSYKQMIQEKRN